MIPSSFSAGQSPGGRLPLLAPAALDADQLRFYQRVTTTLTPKAERAGYQTKLADGTLLGPFNALLYHPALGQGYLDYAAVEGQHSRLTPRIRQLVILAVGAVWHSPYELYAHQAEARAVGFAHAEAQALAVGQLPANLIAAEEVAYRFAYELASQHQVTDTRYQQALAAFSLPDLLDVVLLAARYHMTCVVLNAFAIPAPAATDS